MNSDAHKTTDIECNCGRKGSAISECTHEGCADAARVFGDDQPRHQSTPPQRAHRIVLDAGADTAEALAWELRRLADRIERGEITSGCIGGPDSGSIYSYASNPEMTHDRYFAEVARHLEARNAR